ncbi:hypothetical protein HY497_02325 [Candidatus Woesearchaeota archaeon]|nr:hypothetical protein [Candidatus Woesearchaeota archaeon]
MSRTTALKRRACFTSIPLHRFHVKRFVKVGGLVVNLLFVVMVVGVVVNMV